MRFLPLVLLFACDPGIPDDSGLGTDLDSGGTDVDSEGTDTDTDTPFAAGYLAANDCAPRGTLLDVSRAPGAGAGYARPSLDATCTSTTWTVTTNQMPHYTFVPLTPNALVARDQSWTMPLSPTLATAPATIPLLGPIGVSVAGIPLYGPNEAERPDPYGDPVYNQIVDGCLGHTGMTYHEHALAEKCMVPSGLVAEPWLLDEPDASEPSPILGWAFDGFPIYGPRGCLDEACAEVVTFTSGWVQTGDPSTYAWDNHEYQASDSVTALDACNGRVGPDGTYRYHATATFPYLLGCYMGQR